MEVFVEGLINGRYGADADKKEYALRRTLLASLSRDAFRLFPFPCPLPHGRGICIAKAWNAAYRWGKIARQHSLLKALLLILTSDL